MTEISQHVADIANKRAALIQHLIDDHGAYQTGSPWRGYHFLHHRHGLNHEVSFPDDEDGIPNHRHTTREEWD